MTTIIGKTFNAPARDTGKAYTGRILRVDLSTGAMHVDLPDDAFYRRWIGGRGFILHYLLNEMPAGADPLGPDNLLIFAPGLLTGTALPGSGRHAVGAKSPLTGALVSCEAGGWWGAELKRAGFDAIVLRGRAPEPVYLWVHDGACEIRSAAALWGLPTGEAQDGIRAELGDEKVRTALIGPAGERGVLYAAIMHDVNRAAGRSGPGAVMGSKNLKGVAVRGSQTLDLADKALLNTVVRWMTAGYKDMMGWAVSYGTPGSVKGNHDAGATGVRNYLDGALEGIEKLDAQAIFGTLIQERDTCNRCPVRCKLVADAALPSGERIHPQYGGPEYETIGAMGPLCGINDPLVVAKANELCAAYGLDTISTGGTVAFTMECAQDGLLPGWDFLPRFGDGDSLLEAIRRIAAGEGIGAWMGEGSARMAERIGPAAREKLAVARGQEFPLHDPRLKNTLGMGYALSATGADHMHNLNDSFATWDGGDICARLREMNLPTPLELWGISDVKLRAFYYETAFKNFLDSAVICHFYPYEYHHMVDALRAAGGWDVTADEINAIGTGIVTAARRFLLREGFTAADDTLSARAFHKLADGPIAGRALTPQELRDGLRRYYALMGWDAQGRPAE